MVAGSRIRAGRPPWWPLKNSRNQQIQKCYNSRFLLVTLADVFCGRSWGLGSGFGHEEARFGSQIWSPKSQTHHIYIYVYMYTCIHVYIYIHTYMYTLWYEVDDFMVPKIDLYICYECCIFFLDFCVYCFTLVEWVVELVVELLLVVLLVLLIVLVLPSFLFLLVLVILLEIIKY